MRTITRHDVYGVPLKPETNWFLPTGVENLAEMDGYGRTKRAYLFAGSDRIGFKSEKDTALYIKDHLGSSKLTFSLLRTQGTDLPPTEAGVTAGSWSFDSSFQDESWNKLTATPTGGAGFATGYLDDALQLDGVDDSLDLGFIPAISQSVTDFTISAWVRLSTDRNTMNYAWIIESGPHTVSGVHLRLNPTGHLVLATGAQGVASSVGTPADTYPNDGAWHHLAVTRLNGAGTIYLDGVQVASGTLADPDDSSYNTKLGDRIGSPPTAWPGWIDQVQILDRAKTTLEVETDFHTDRARAGQTPVPQAGYWTLDDHYQDGSGNNLTATPNGDTDFDAGYLDKGLLLDGVDDSLDLGYVPALSQNVTDFTFTAWVRLSTDRNTMNYAWIIESGPHTVSGVHLRLNPTGHLILATSAQGVASSIGTPADTYPNDGAWHHLAVTRQTGTGKIYLDGLQVASGTLADPDDSSYSTILGDRIGNPPTAWPGWIDEIKIEPRAHSATEIQAAFTVDRSRAGRTPISLEDRFLMTAADTGPYGLPFRETYQGDLDPDYREPHGFTGQEKEPLLGLLYYGARWYMADIGRFLQVDPANQYWNSYSYTGNKPTIRVDPTGKLDTDPIKEFPIEVKMARLAERFAQTNYKLITHLINQGFTRSGSRNRLGRINQNFTQGKGSKVSGDHNIGRARASYKYGTIFVVPLDKKAKKITLLNTVLEVITFFHEIAHDVNNDDPGIVLYVEYQKTKVNISGISDWVGDYDMGEILETDVFGGDVSEDGLQLLIDNREKYGNRAKFKALYSLVDFVSSQLNLKPGDSIDTSEFVKRLEK